MAGETAHEPAAASPPGEVDLPPGVEATTIEEAAPWKMPGTYGHQRVLYVRKHVAAQWITGATAVVITIGTVRWGFEAKARFDSDRASWFRTVQLVWALTGIASAIAATFANVACSTPFLKMAFSVETGTPLRLDSASKVIPNSWRRLSNFPVKFI